MDCIVEKVYMSALFSYVWKKLCCSWLEPMFFFVLKNIS